ncbi:hypothetical protein [Salinibacter sp.]|uniref:hypothetical protein n=1 Tax=Salinibacter sp. TaxID=2065818 RepID=UPI0021E81DB0|nr:hypothetical protein [Salinibacter sp.]
MGDDVRQFGEWGVVWESSGNVEQLAPGAQIEGGQGALVVGTLLGDLRHSEGLLSRDEQTLGQDALGSNGSFAVIIPGRQEITVVTDVAGSIPVCWTNGPDGVALGTRTHEVARLVGEETLDRTAVVDYLMHGSIVHPYTWFEDVRRLPPASICTIDEAGLRTYRYWEPTEPESIYKPCDAEDWGRRLRKEVQSSIVDALGDASKVRVFFSGGADSRSIGSLIPDDIECVLTTVLDSKNREYHLARRAAQALGRTFEWVPRPEGYYKTAVRERIEAIGPGWDFRHAHFLKGIRETFRDADVLVGGYSADTSFKDYYMGNVEEGRGLTLDSLSEPDPDEIDVLKKGEEFSEWFAPDLVAEVRERRQNHHRRLKEIRPMTAGNWHALWPISNAPHFPQYLGELRIGPRVVEPFLFQRVYRLAANMPDWCREDQRAFHHAFAKDVGLAGWLPVSYGGIPRLNGYLGQVVAKVIGRTRLLKRYINPPTGTQGPWTPNHYGWAPVAPEEHFRGAASHRMRDRLEGLLAEKTSSETFLSGSRVSNEAVVRALALAIGSQE